MHIDDYKYLLINNILKRWKRPNREKSRVEDIEDSTTQLRSRIDEANKWQTREIRVVLTLNEDSLELQTVWCSLPS
jgi:hypothetical protein